MKTLFAIFLIAWHTAVPYTITYYGRKHMWEGFGAVPFSENLSVLSLIFVLTTIFIIIPIIGLIASIVSSIKDNKEEKECL